MRLGVLARVRRRAPPTRQLASAVSTVQLNYQEKPQGGFRLGRYVVPPSHYQYDVVDVQVPRRTAMHDARQLAAPPTLETMGFELRTWPTACTDFENDLQVMRGYYREVHDLVRQASGASQVLLFDHVLRRSSGVHTAARAHSGLIAAAAPVERVHSDYTEESARLQLERVLAAGVYSHGLRRILNVDEIQQLAACPYALFSVWRSIDSSTPVQRSHLALCDRRTVQAADRLYYEVLFSIYDDTSGENYGLRFNESHRWYFFPEMSKDECLVIKAFAESTGEPQLLFHTSFDSPHTSPDAPARQSIEVRAVAFSGPAVRDWDLLQAKAGVKQGRVMRKYAVHE